MWELVPDLINEMKSWDNAIDFGILLLVLGAVDIPEETKYLKLSQYNILIVLYWRLTCFLSWSLWSSIS